MKRKILLATADRAERGLLEPIVQRLKNHSEVDFLLFEFKPEEPVSEVLEAFQVVLDTFKPHIVAVPCDRREMVPLAWSAFSKNIVVAHILHAGDIGSGVQDEAYRWAISRLSHIMFTNSWESAWNLIRAGEEEWRVYPVGSTILDDMELDDSIVPKEPYDLFLLNPDTTSEQQTLLDVAEALSKIDKLTIAIYPNEDVYRDLIIEMLHKAMLCNEKIKVFEKLPRNQFLGLLKNCQRFIGNSSAQCYEAPYFGVQTVKIGHRNRDRPQTQINVGASEKIVRVLAQIPINEKLLRKKLNL